MNTEEEFDPYLLDLGSDAQDRWEQLLNMIDEGKVIPVIGQDLLVDPIISQDKDGMQIRENLHQQLISFLSKYLKLHSHPRTFSQLVYDEEFKRNAKAEDKEWKIYDFLFQITSKLDKYPMINSQPSQLLMDLLGTKKFPFVITTSFTPIVENAMREVWGDVKVLNFNNNPADSSPERGGDIRDEEDLKQPTVYYMFGKACPITKSNNSQDVRFAVKDMDMMRFCSSWIKGDGVPLTLTNSLKDKYLLILGNNYSDWLFRFVWYSLRSKTDDDLKSNMKEDVVVRDNAEESLKQFLERLQTFYQDNPEEVVRRIKEDMERRRPLKKHDTKSAITSSDATDVFISYSHTDIVLAKNLYNKLTQAGINVWFDDNSIKKGADWAAKIKSGIKKTSLIVPILSLNIEREFCDDHEYRNEWNLAAHRAALMGDRPFILPFAEKGFDFYDSDTRLPQEFVDKNATWYQDENDLDEICEAVKNALKEIQEKKNKSKNS